MGGQADCHHTIAKQRKTGLAHQNLLSDTYCEHYNTYSVNNLLPPPRYPSGRVLASRAGGPGFNPQSRTASYQRRYKNGTSSSLV